MSFIERSNLSVPQTDGVPERNPAHDTHDRKAILDEIDATQAHIDGVLEDNQLLPAKNRYWKEAVIGEWGVAMTTYSTEGGWSSKGYTVHGS